MSTLAKRKRTGNDASDPSDAGRKKVRPAAASTIEIKNSGRIKRYVSRACAYLKKAPLEEIRLVAVDGAITKAITVLEIMKRTAEIDSSKGGTEVTISMKLKEKEGE